MKLLIFLVMTIMLIGIGSCTGGISFDDKLSTLTELDAYEYWLHVGYYTGLNVGHVAHNPSASSSPVRPFDIFPDNATNGSYAYFGWGRGVWHNLSLNITVPVNATNFTVKWQWMSGYLGDVETDWTDLNVTQDTCGNFSTPGACNVDFVVNNSKWDILRMFTTPYSKAGAFIRARVMNSSGITEGGASSTLDCNSYSIVSRGASDDMEDIWAEEELNNWGWVEKLNKYYWIKSNFIIIGNFTINEWEMVEIGRSGTARYMSITNDNGIFQMGRIESNGMTSQASMLKYWTVRDYTPYNYWYGDVRIYNSLLLGGSTNFQDMAIRGKVDMQSSIYGRMKTSGTNMYIVSGSTGTMKNVFVEGVNSLYQYSTGIIFDNLVITKGAFASTQNWYNRGDIYNVDLTYPFNQTVKWTSGIDQCYDCYYGPNEDYVPHFYSNTNCGGDADYTFTLEIKNETGSPLVANVTLVDNNNTEYFNGSFNKNSTYVTVFSQRDFGAGDVNTYYNPFTLKVSHPDYADFEADFNITYNNKYFTLVAQEGGSFTTGNALIIRKGENNMEMKQCT